MKTIFVLLTALALGGTVIAQETDTISDQLAIKELAARFEKAFDDGDMDAHMATWAQEMSFESPFGTYDTREGYRGWVEGFYNQMSEQYGGTRHIVANHEISVDGDTATMTAYLIIFGRNGNPEGDTPQPVVAGTAAFTDDQLERVDGEWLFTHRTLVFDQAGGQ